MADTGGVDERIQLKGFLEFDGGRNSLLVNPKRDPVSEIKPIYSISISDAPPVKLVYSFLQSPYYLLRVLTLLGCQWGENGVTILFEDVFGGINQELRKERKGGSVGRTEG